MAMSDRPSLTVIEGDAPRPMSLAEMNETADRMIRHLAAQPLEQRVEQARDGYRMTYPHVRDPHVWLSLLTQAVADVARPLTRDALCGHDDRRDRRLREAESFCEMTAACAMELAVLVREMRTEPPA